MALNKKQKTFLEALSLYLDLDAQLGLKDHEKNPLNDLERVNGLEFTHNDIYSKYRKKLEDNNIVYIGPILQAFNKVHDYKYFDNPSFGTAMESELNSQAVHSSEIALAIALLNELYEELRKSDKTWKEKDSGLFQDMEGIKEVSQPKQADDFAIIKTGLNKKNVEDIHAEFE